jgi:exodeoxyribonuclease VII large subunit
MNSQQPLTVSQLTSNIKKMLEGRFSFITVAGEISNLRRPASGHCYFTLKDDQAQLKAVLFRMQQKYLEEQPRDGRMVVCRGRITVYEPRGDYQLIVDSMDFHGAGSLQLAFEQLKKKLAAEGLFDESIKKPLPILPEHITLVTSATGAAVHDFIRIARARWPRIRISIYPAAVQGEGAADELRRALADINARWPTEVIVLCRGGGSIEDLWAFNDEELAREIRRSTIPVVSAVGHEIDFTIADFAADLRAPTPSGAAEMLLPDSTALAERVEELARRLERNMASRLDQWHGRLALCRQQLATAAHPVDTLLLRLDHLAGRLDSAMEHILDSGTLRLTTLENRLQQTAPLHTVIRRQREVEGLGRRLCRSIQVMLREKEQQLARNSGLLHAVSPLSTLARGYAVARKKTTPSRPVITSPDQVRTGEEIEIILHQGSLQCSVLEKTGTK